LNAFEKRPACFKFPARFLAVNHGHVVACIHVRVSLSLVQGSDCTIGPPGPPANLVATPGDAEITLTWDKPDNGNCIFLYSVTKEIVGQAAGYEVIETSDYNYTLTGLENGVTYSLAVTAVSSSDFAETASATVTATPNGPVPEPSPEPVPSPEPSPEPVDPGCTSGPAGPPANLVATPGDAEITLTWDKPENGNCIFLYSVTKQILGDEASVLEVIETPDYSYTLTGLENGVTYKLTVTAVSSSDFAQTASSSVTATPNGPVPEPSPEPVPSPSTCSVGPPGPASNVVVIPGDSQLEIQWDSPENGNCIFLYVLNAVALDQEISALSAIETPDYSYTLTNLQNDVTYNITITSVSGIAPYQGETASISVLGTPTDSKPHPWFGHHKWFDAVRSHFASKIESKEGHSRKWFSHGQ
jgi:hypothetical protein